MEVKYSSHGLVPAIIQDAQTKNVLMLGYMNAEAVQKTLETKKVTFFSRSRQRLWTKGEESGNFLNLINLKIDCDNDTLLIQAIPEGSTCHKGTDTCWGEVNSQSFGFLSELEDIIKQRKENASGETSYVASLFEKGINKIAQKLNQWTVMMIYF